jgi:SAM-dependent methyltransferase
VTRYTDYDRFADVYNRHWGGFARQVTAPLDLLGLSDLQPGDHVLDLCCGTGQLAALLTDRGLRVTGVDGSEEMIAVAHANAPDAALIVADARSFAIESPAVMAVSTFDSLNHIMDLDGLEKAFRQVAAALEPRGRFVFDLNMDEGFRARWHGTFVIDDPDELIVAVSAYDAAERAGSVNLIMLFREDDLWRRRDLTLTQRAYSADEVGETLRNAGFVDIEVHDAAELMNGWQAGRSFFSAVRR